MWNVRSAVIFVVALLVLRRFGVQVSILGSIALTIVLTGIMNRLGAPRNGNE